MNITAEAVHVYSRFICRDVNPIGSPESVYANHLSGLVAVVTEMQKFAI